MGETARTNETTGNGYVYIRPEGEPKVEPRDTSAIDNLSEEAAYHQDRLAFSFVKPEGDVGWTKASVLDAIATGNADAFSVNWITFPPVPGGERVPQHTAYLFDDREFGERIANKVLVGFSREPRSPNNE